MPADDAGTVWLSFSKARVASANWMSFLCSCLFRETSMSRDMVATKSSASSSYASSALSRANCSAVSSPAEGSRSTLLFSLWDATISVAAINCTFS